VHYSNGPKPGIATAIWEDGSLNTMDDV
jgi:hypothetical protein